MRVAASLGILAIAVGLSGCNKEEAPKPAFNTGAQVRFVNLTQEDITFKLGITGDTPTKGWGHTAFTRCPPKNTEIVAKRQDKPDEKFNVELKPSSRYSVYGVDRGGKFEYVTIEADPKDVGEGKVVFRAISFHKGDVDVSIKPTLGDVLEAKGLKDGQPSSELSASAQKFTVTVTSGGKTIGTEAIEAEGGASYTVAVPADGKAIKVFRNNAPMLASPGGASPT